MKQLKHIFKEISMIVAVMLFMLCMSFNATAQVGYSGSVGKPNAGTTDTISSAGSYTMALTSAPTTFGNLKILSADLTLTKIDSISGVYVKLQARSVSTGQWFDVATANGDSTYVTFPNVTSTQVVHTSPLRISPLLYPQFRLLMVLPRASKFTVSGRWIAL